MPEKYRDLEAISYYNKFTNMEEIGGKSTINEILRGHSIVGFLGKNEDIVAVKEADYETLQKHGLSYEEIASPLERIAHSAFQVFLERKNSRILLACDYSPVEFSGEAGADKKIPRLIRAHRENKMLKTVSGVRYEVIVKKIEDASCPWSRLPEPEFSKLRCGYGAKENYDFNVKNLETGKAFHYNLLQVHMIRAHMFFEGSGTNLNIVKNPYRIEPKEAIEALGLITSDRNKKEGKK
jgi:hypothetical protein